MENVYLGEEERTTYEATLFYRNPIIKPEEIMKETIEKRKKIKNKNYNIFESIGKRLDDYFEFHPYRDWSGHVQGSYKAFDFH